MDRGKWKAIWDSLKLYCLYLFIPALLLLIGMTLRRGQITVDEFMDQSGYIIQIRPFILSEDVSDFDYDVYKTEEYMVFAAEGSGEDYLWHKGRLYCSYYDNDHITYRDIAWEDLGFEAYAEDRWNIVRQLLERDDPELTYQYIRSPIC